MIPFFSPFSLIQSFWPVAQAVKSCNLCSFFLQIYKMIPDSSPFLYFAPIFFAINSPRQNWYQIFRRFLGFTFFPKKTLGYFFHILAEKNLLLIPNLTPFRGLSCFSASKPRFWYLFSRQFLAKKIFECTNFIKRYRFYAVL